MNHVAIMGRLTAAPELKQSQSGTMFTRFAVAINRPVKQGQEKQTDFINCTAFNKTAEFIGKYFTKGAMIAVEGSLRTGSYQDNRYPDVKHYTCDVWVEKAHFTGEKAQDAQNGSYSVPNGGYSNYTTHAPTMPQTGAQPPQNAGIDMSGFEEIISDGDLPF